MRCGDNDLRPRGPSRQLGDIRRDPARLVARSLAIFAAIRRASTLVSAIASQAHLTHAASVDCLLYLINRSLRRQGIGGRSNLKSGAAFSPPRFLCGGLPPPHLTAPPTPPPPQPPAFYSPLQFPFFP